jgi:uncharacterized protein GlcG (DUF336 family)
MADTLTYGVPLDLETARKTALLALAEARQNGWMMAVAVVDPAGELVYFERMDMTQFGSTGVAIEKARSAARFKRPTRAFQDMLAQGGEGLRVLRIRGAVPVEGGVPLIAGSTIVGGLGVSGGTSQQDGQCAQAALAAIL